MHNYTHRSRLSRYLQIKFSLKLIIIIFIQLDGPQPAILQEVSVPVWSNSECKLKYGAAAPGGIVDSFLCAGRAAKDSCSVRVRILRYLVFAIYILLTPSAIV